MLVHILYNGRIRANPKMTLLAYLLQSIKCHTGDAEGRVTLAPHVLAGRHGLCGGDPVEETRAVDLCHPERAGAVGGAREGSP